MFEVKVTLEGADEPLTEDWSANGRDKDLEKLREWLEREKERRDEHEEVEREMVWIFMHRLMIDPCQLWSRKKPLVLNHLPSHQSLPSFQSTSRPTASGRDQTPAPIIFPASPTPQIAVFL